MKPVAPVMKISLSAIIGLIDLEIAKLCPARESV
jgi:hypothetical protein